MAINETITIQDNQMFEYNCSVSGATSANKVVLKATTYPGLSVSTPDTAQTNYLSCGVSLNGSGTNWGGRGYQLRLDFTPTETDSAKIGSVKLYFKARFSNTQTGFRICPTYKIPNVTTEVWNGYVGGPSYRYLWYNSGQCANMDANTYATFGPNSAPTTVALYEVDITNVYKKCLDKGINWYSILLYQPVDTPTNVKVCKIYYPYNPQIKITYAYSSCGAPTSVTSNMSIQKPNANVTISWSGATAGTNNAINKYVVYWKINGAPTLSSYDGKIDITSSNTSGTCTFSIGNERGDQYYVGIQTCGNASVSGYDSAISSNKAIITVNTLPSQPERIVLDKIKLPSTKGIITVTECIPGSDINNKVHYSIDSSGTKTPISKNGTIDFSGPGYTSNNSYVIHFYTFDGLEYSNSSVDKTIRITKKPVITSLTMTDANGIEHQNGSDILSIKVVANVVKDEDANLRYYWEILSSSDQNFTTTTTSALDQSNNNILTKNVSVPVTEVQFNDYYKIISYVRDIDTNETSINAQTSNFYHIKNCPTAILYNTNDSNNKNGTNSNHFEDYIRITFDNDSDILTGKQLIYNVANNSRPNIELENQVNDILIQNVNRGDICNFSVKMTCNSITKIQTLRSLTRVPNISMIIETQPSTGTIIRPYSHNQFTCSIRHQNIIWNNSYDLSGISNYSFYLQKNNSIDEIKLKVNEPVIQEPSSVNNYTAIFTLNLWEDANNNLINPDTWKNLFGDYPHDNKNMTLKIVVKNNFNKDLEPNSQSINISFKENLIINNVNCKIGILTENSPKTYKYINDSTNPIYSIYNKYLLFPTQKLEFFISNIKTYIKQNIDIKILDQNGTKLWEKQNISNTYTNETHNFKFDLINNNDYELSYNFFESNKKDINFKIYLKYSSDNDETNNWVCITQDALNICKMPKIDTKNINPIIKNCDNDGTSAKYNCYFDTNTNNNETIDEIFNDIKGIVKYLNNNNYDTLIEPFNIIINENSFNQDVTVNNLTPAIQLNQDIYYLILNIEFTFKIQKLTIDNIEIIPITSKYTAPYSFNPQIYTFYRAVPNLLYGKNFFVINASTPKMNGNNEVNDQLLVIRPNNNRKKIYIGLDGHEGILEINDNYGLIIDGGTWDS